MTTNKFATFLMSATLLLGTLNLAQAEDKKVDPTGTYVWTMPGRNGGPDRTNTLALKLDGDKLTGKISSPGRGGAVTDTEIADAKLTDARFAKAKLANSRFTNADLTNADLKGADITGADITTAKGAEIDGAVRR